MTCSDPSRRKQSVFSSDPTRLPACCLQPSRGLPCLERGAAVFPASLGAFYVPSAIVLSRRRLESPTALGMPLMALIYRTVNK